MLKFQYYDNVETTFLLYTVITGGSQERQYILKNKNVLENVIHFIVHNSFMFTVAIMGLVHAVLLSVMIYAHVQPLVYFNILSVTIYLFCVLSSIAYCAGQRHRRLAVTALFPADGICILQIRS